MRCGVQEPVQLQNLLELFFGYEREEIADFRKAVEQFKTDLPEVLKALRDMIEAEQGNVNFRKDALRFLERAQDTINPSVTAADVREMLIQHILTEEMFSQVFDDSNFHRQNNVAKELDALANTFFTGKVKHDTLAGLRPYYAAIKSAAALVTGHHEKQNFLKLPDQSTTLWVDSFLHWQHAPSGRTIRLHVSRRHQLYSVPKFCKFAPPIMRRRAGFHPNQARFETRHEREHLGPSETFANNRRAIRIDGVNLKYSLGEINADCGNLHGGRPLSTRRAL